MTGTATAQPTPLPHHHLMTLELDVATEQTAVIGETPNGRRSIAPIRGGVFRGDQLNGDVLPGGADWVVTRADGVMLIDVRLTLKTDDAALIYLTYAGRFIGEAGAMSALARGETLDPKRYSLAMAATFESGHDKYAWLNDEIAVGTGAQNGFDPIYTIYSIGSARQIAG